MNEVNTNFKKNGENMMRKNIILISVLVLMLAVAPISSAESFTEPTGDVFHWWQSGGSFTWEYDASKEDIDITEYSYDITGGTLTLSMKVAGEINSGELYTYTISFISENDGSTYMVTYVGGNATTYYYSMTGGGTGEATASGGTLTGSFDTTINDPSNYEMVVTANQYTVLNDVTNEYWVDSNQLNDEDTDTGSNDDNTDNSDSDSIDVTNENDDTNVPPPTGTPGFEIFALISAMIGILFIIKRRN